MANASDPVNSGIQSLRDYLAANSKFLSHPDTKKLHESIEAIIEAATAQQEQFTDTWIRHYIMDAKGNKPHSARNFQIIRDDHSELDKKIKDLAIKLCSSDCPEGYGMETLLSMQKTVIKFSDIPNEKSENYRAAED